MMLRLGSALMLLPAVLPLPAAAQGRITYCCTDNTGQQVCSDVLPKQCYGKVYREINSRGITVRRVDAPLNAEQRAAKEADAKKAKEEEARRLEQDRRNRALLATYATEQDIDYARDRAMADVRKAIKESQDKQAELAKRKQKLDAEAEFYKKKTLPAEVDKGLKDADYEIRAQEELIASKAREMELIKAKYDEDRRRFRDLKNRMRKQ